MQNFLTEIVYVSLLEEGTPTMRGTQAEILENGTYKLLATENYDPEDEIWEFIPGSIVKCEKRTTFERKIVLFAVEQVSA